MQINVWHNKLLSNVIKLINQENPDVVCMQEFLDAEQTTVFYDFYSDGYRFMKEHTQLSELYYAPYLSFDIAGVKVYQGNAIFSKHPFVTKETIFTRGEFTHYNVSQGTRHSTYNLQIVTFKIQDKTFAVANHHGYYLTNSMGDETTELDMKKVVSTLKKFSSPLVLCGDLNIVAKSPAMRAFDGFLTDLTETFKINSTLSSLHDITNIACDHILVNDSIRVDSFKASDEIVSDHKALILEFR